MSLEHTPTCYPGTQHAFHTLNQSMVTVKVGPELHPFIIHKERLCHYSSYFKSALTGQFKESAEGAVELPDQDIKVFEIVEHWLYTQKLEHDSTEDLDQWHSGLFRIYVFSDRFDMPLLKNAAVDAIVAAESEDLDRSLPGVADIDYVYMNTPPESPLRRLLVAMVAFNTTPESFERAMRELPTDFVCQVALVNIARIPHRRLEGELAPFEENVCQYHEHINSTDICAAKQKKPRRGSFDRVP